MRKTENVKSLSSYHNSPAEASQNPQLPLSSPPSSQSRRSHLIPEAELEQLKREISLVALVQSYGITLKQQGQDFIGRCPFHDDATPSLSITPAKNLWHCQGACNMGGSNIDWVMKIEKVGFRRAVEILRERSGMGLGTENAAAEGKNKVGKTRLAAPVEMTSDDQKLFEQVVSYYQATLLKTPQPLQYLASRGIAGAEVICEFRLGFADRSLGMRLPKKSRARQADIRARLQQLGILRDSGHELMTGSVVVPLTDENGLITGLYGRKSGKKLRVGTPLHLYLPGPHRGFFNAKCVRETREIILCEAIIDALSFWVHGLRNVTASYGVNGFTNEMRQAFLRHKIEKVYIAFDADDAGDRAARELAQWLDENGIACYRVEFPQGMDANNFVCQKSFHPEMLRALVDQAIAMTTAAKEENMPVTLPTLEPQGLEGVAAATEEEKGEEASAAEFSPLAASSPESEPFEGVAAARTGKFSSSAAPHLASEKSTTATQSCSLRRRGEVVEFVRADRLYRVKGVKKNLSLESMRITLHALRNRRIYIDSLDLYNARQRQAFMQAASSTLEVEPELVGADLTDLMLELEYIQERQLEESLKPKKGQESISEEERAAALAFLRALDMVARILNDFERCGLVGEKDNALIEYLAMTSRIMNNPLALIIQSVTAAGKTTLMNFGLEFMPPEEVIKYTAMSGQSLFYMGETDLKHKILAISEEKGAEKAAYPLKIMQSEGELCMASAGKDPKSGRFVTHEYHVEGPANILVATTALEIDEEFANRCLFIMANEESEQTRAIQEEQRRRETLEWLLLQEERKRIRRLHQNVQRLLKPVFVINHYARQLTFLDNQVRYRRDQPKYLALIRASALLHQYQRPKGRRILPSGEVIEYIEVALEDIALANRLFAHAMGGCLDQLPPQTRKLLSLIRRMVDARCAAEKIEQHKCLFTRREVREYTAWSDAQLKVHIHRLLDMEYLVNRQGQNGFRHVYELMYKGEGEGGERFLLGLTDVEKLSGRSTDEIMTKPVGVKIEPVGW